MKNLLGERIKGKLRDYNLIRIKENDLYKTYEIFGYNGINLFLKQKIGIKKKMEDNKDKTYDSFDLGILYIFLYM